MQCGYRLGERVPLIDEHDIFRLDRHRGTREDQTSAEAHLHTENLPIDGDSTSQPAPNARPVMRAKPLAESVARGFAGVMDEEGRRSIGCREDFHDRDFERSGPVLKQQHEEKFTPIHDYTHRLRSSVRYWTASERCFGSRSSAPSRSAIVLETFKMRS